MRILIATTNRAVVGGVETYLRSLLPALLERGHEVALLYEKNLEAQHFVDEALPADRSWLLSKAGMEAAVRWRPEICYAQGMESPEAEAAVLEHFPTVRFVHDYHATCVSGSKRHALPSPRPCDRTLGLGCLFAYYPCRCGGLNPVTMLQLYSLKKRRLALLPEYQGIVVASSYMKREYARHGVAEAKLHLIPLFAPGGQPDVLPPVARARTGRVLFVGRLTDLKGPLLLVEAIRLAQRSLEQPLTLVVGGEGPERTVVEAECRKHGVRLEMHGWVSAGKREELMRGADVLAVPGTWPEPFGLVGLEAGNVGLPVVAFGIGGITDWLSSGESGEVAVADPPSAVGFAAAIVRSVQNQEHWQRLRMGAWRMTSRFGKENHLGLLETLLRRVVENQVVAGVS